MHSYTMKVITLLSLVASTFAFAPLSRPNRGTTVVLQETKVCGCRIVDFSFHYQFFH